MGVSIGSFQAVTLAMEGGGVYSHCLSDEGGGVYSRCCSHRRA